MSTVSSYRSGLSGPPLLLPSLASFPDTHGSSLSQVHILAQGKVLISFAQDRDSRWLCTVILARVSKIVPTTTSSSPAASGYYASDDCTLMLPIVSFCLPSFVCPCFISATWSCTRRNCPRSAASHYLAAEDISGRVYSTTAPMNLPQTPPHSD